MKKHQNQAGDLIILERGEELISTLKKYAADRSLTSAVLQSGVGGADSVELSFYDLSTKSYIDKVFDEPLEIVSLQGNLTQVDGQPFWHIHGIFGRRDYQTISGHVNNLSIALTGEIFIVPLESNLTRQYDETTGLRLIS